MLLNLPELPTSDNHSQGPAELWGTRDGCHTPSFAESMGKSLFCDQRLWVIDHHLSVIDNHWSVIDHRLSVIENRRSVIDDRLSAIAISELFYDGFSEKWLGAEMCQATFHLGGVSLIWPTTFAKERVT